MKTSDIRQRLKDVHTWIDEGQYALHAAATPNILLGNDAAATLLLKLECELDVRNSQQIDIAEFPAKAKEWNSYTALKGEITDTDLRDLLDILTIYPPSKDAEFFDSLQHSLKSHLEIIVEPETMVEHLRKMDDWTRDMDSSFADIKLTSREAGSFLNRLKQALTDRSGTEIDTTNIGTTIKHWNAGFTDKDLQNLSEMARACDVEGSDNFFNNVAEAIDNHFSQQLQKA